MKVICAVLFASLIILANAGDNTCGNNCEWTIEDGKLKISGTGAMSDYDVVVAPWREHAASVRKIKVEGLEVIGLSAFESMYNVEKAEIDAEEIKDNAFENCSKLEDVEFSDNVKKIREFVFKDCKSLEALTLSKSIEKFAETAVSECENLAEIKVDKNNEKFTAEGGVLFSDGKKILVKYPPAKIGKEYDVPDTVSKIGRYAFVKCPSLESLIIPASVTAISDEGFTGCSKLSFVEYQGTSDPGSSNVFVDCSQLSYVCVTENYTDSIFCGIEKVIKCHSSEESSVVVIPSFLTLVVMAILAYFF